MHYYYYDIIIVPTTDVKVKGHIRNVPTKKIRKCIQNKNTRRK